MLLNSSGIWPTISESSIYCHDLDSYIDTWWYRRYVWECLNILPLIVDHWHIYIFIRPDIAFAMNRLSRSLNAHRASYPKAASQAMRYSKRFPRMGLIYRRKTLIIRNHCSSVSVDKVSSAMIVLSIGSQIMQTTVVNSSAELELFCNGCLHQRAKYLEKLLTELDIRLKSHFIMTKVLQDSLGVKLKLFGDNQRGVWPWLL